MCMYLQQYDNLQHELESHEFDENYDKPSADSGMTPEDSLREILRRDSVTEPSPRRSVEEFNPPPRQSSQMIGWKSTSPSALSGDMFGKPTVEKPRRNLFRLLHERLTVVSED